MLVSRNARDHCMNSALSKAVRLSDCSDHDTWNTHMPTWHNCWHKWRSPTSYFALSLMELDTTLLLHPFNGLFSRQAWVSRYQKGKTSLDLTEVRDDGVLGCSGISWTICKQSAPHSRQITTLHLITQLLQAECFSWCPTNNVKALKAIVILCL